MSLSPFLTDSQRTALAAYSRDDDAYHHVVAMVEGLLAQADRRYQALFERTNDAIFLIDTDDQFVDVNHRAAEMLGYSADELRGMHASLPIVPEERSAAMQVRHRLLAGELLPVYERTLQRKDGTYLHCEVDIALVFDEDGRNLYTQSIVRDISERKKLEAELQQERTLLHTVIDAIPDPIYVKDRQGRFTLVNQASLNTSGLDTPEPILGKTDLDHGWHRSDEFYDAEQELMRTGVPMLNQEFGPGWRTDPDDDTCLLITKVPLYDQQGECIGLVGINRDITPVKRLERSLRSESNLLRIVINTIPDPIYVKDRDSRFTLANHAALDPRKLGVKVDTLIGKTDFDLGTPGAETFYAQEQEMMRTGVPIFNVEDSRQDAANPDNDLWVLISKIPLRDDDGRIIGMVGINREITQTKRLENRLTEERNLLRSVIDTLPDAIYVKDRDHRFTLVNSTTWKGARLTSADDMLGKTDADFYMPLMDTQSLYASEKALLESGLPIVNHRVDIAGSDQVPPFSLLITKVPLRNQQGEIVGLIGINHDISSTLRLENELRAERNLLRKVIDAIPDPIYVKDRQSRFRMVNEAITLSDTRFSADYFIGKSDIDIWGPSRNALAFFEVEQRLMATGESLINYAFSNDFPHAPDNNNVLITKVPLRDENGEVIGIIGINRNIAVLKRLENELRDERNLLRSLIDAIPDVIYIKDRQARFILVNSRQEENLARVQAGSPIGRTDYDYFGDYAEADYRNDMELMATGQRIINREFQIPAPYNTQIGSGWVTITKVPLRDASGEVIGLVGINRDISQIKRLQENLLDERNLLRTIIDAIPDEIYVKDREHRFMLVNHANLTQRGFTTPEQVVGKTDAELFPEVDQDLRADEEQVFANGEPLIYNQYHVLPQYARPDREWLMVSKVPLRNAAGEIVGIVGVNHNITALKHLENQFRTERNLLRTIIDALPDEVYVKDRESRFTLLNKASMDHKLHVFGRSPIGLSDADLFPLLADAAQSDEQYILATGATVTYNEYHNPVEYRTPEREWLAINKVPLRDDNGDIIGIVGVNHNITRRKHLENELRNERNLLRSVIDAIPEDIYVKDRASRFVLINQALVNKLGMETADQLIGFTDFDILEPRAYDWYLQEQQLMAADESSLNVVDYSDGLGTRLGGHWVTNTKVPLHDQAGQVIGIIGINHDITMLKRLEEDLRDERNLLRSVIDAIPEDIYVKDRASRFILLNQALVRKLGLRDADQLLGLTDFDVTEPGAHDLYFEEQRLMANDLPIVSRLAYSDGRGTSLGEHWITITKVPLHDPVGKVIGVIGINHDITPLKQLEEHLRAERNLLRSVIDVIPDDIYVKDRASRFILANRALLGKLGIDHSDQLIGLTDFDLFGLLPQKFYLEEQRLMAANESSISQPYHTVGEGTIIGEHWVTISKLPLHDENGQVIGIIGVNHNVTQIMRLEQRVRDERNLLRSVIDAIPDEIYVKDLDSRFVLVNQTMLEIAGQTSHSAILGKNDLEIYGEVAKATHYEREQVIFATGEPILNQEFHIADHYATEDRNWVLISKVPLRDAQGNIIGLIGINHNITLLKRLEQRVRNERNLLRTLIDSIPDEVYAKDRQSRFLLANKAVLRRVQASSDDELIGKTDADLYGTEVYTRNFSIEQRLMATGSTLINVEHQDMDRINGAEADWTLVTKVPFHDADGNIVGLIGVNHDITDLKHLEYRLRDERNLLRTVVDAIPDEIYVKDRASRFILVNNALLSGHPGSTDSDFIGRNDEEVFGGEIDQRHRQNELDVLETGRPMVGFEFPIEAELATDDRSWMLITKVPLRDPEGRVIGLVGVNHNITQLKRLEQRVREERNLLRATIDTIPDEIYVKNRQHQFILVNQATAEHFGLSAPDELIGKTDTDLLSDRSETFIREEAHLLTTGEPIMSDAALVTDEQRVDKGDYLLTTKVPLRDPDGHIIGLIGINRNITHLKQLEHTLREERNLLRAIIDAIPDEIYVKDREGRHTLDNRATLEGYGFTDEKELLGKTDADFSKALSDAFAPGEQRLLATGQPILNVEYKIIPAYAFPSSRHDWQLISKVPLYDAEKNIIGIIGINRDISAIKQVQQDLLDSQRFSERVTQTVPDMVYVLEFETRHLIYFNRSLQTILGYPETFELTFADIDWHPDDQPRLMQAYRNLLTLPDGEVVDGEYRFMHASGEWRWLRLRDAIFRRNTNGSPREILGILQDVTERKIAQIAELQVESLRVAISKEQELGDLKARMMIRISHEFRTPLAVIGTSSEMLQRYYNRMDDDRRAMHFEQITDQINRIATILDDITVIMRVQMSGRVALQLDLQNLCSEVLRTDPHSSRITFTCDDDLPQIEGDQEMLMRMIHSAVSNAIKYSPPNSPVGLHLSADAHAVHMSIRDEGSGISTSDLPRIFEPFYRGSNIEEVQGMGLGLSIVKAVVDLHAGHVDVDTEPGSGTTLTIHLPITMPQE